MRKGQKVSEETRRRMSEGMKGRTAWNKGLTKEDLRVRKYCESEGSKKTQYKSGKRPERCLNKNPNWKGGRIIKRCCKNGLDYWMVRLPKHPAQVNNYVLEHRVVMENHIGRYLIEGEVIHHINGNPLDNNLKNLVLLTRGQHMRVHNLNRWRKK